MKAVTRAWPLACVLVLVLAGAFCPTVQGQSTFGKILGNVFDANGAVIPGAEVTLIDQATNIVRATKTNEAGIYEFVDLVPGRYQLEVRREGFKTFVQKDIDLSSRQTIRIDPGMQLGTVAETVTVTAAAGLIETETASVAGTVRGGEPFFLSPNTTSQRPWDMMRLDPLVQNSNSSTRFTMAGAYFNQAEYHIDGISVPLGTGSLAGSMVMSSEALAEVKILAVNNNAEYASPGVYEQISKGGTNTFHGDLFYHFASSALNARRADQTAKAANHDHRFGGNVGGPIRIPKLYNGRDRTFFSASYQTDRAPGSTTYVATVPTTNMRDGIFAGTVRDPLTGQPFPNATIPSDRVNEVSRKVQNLYYPLPTIDSPTLVTNNSQVVGPNGTTREDVADFRVDQHISDRHWMYGRIGGTQFNNRAYDAGLPTMGFRAATRKLYTSVLSYTWTLRPSLLNEARVGYVRDNSPAGGSNNGLTVLKTLGITFPADLQPPDARGFPVFSITGPTPLAQQNTAANVSQSYQFTDTLSWIKKRHSFKTGINIFWEQPNIVRVPSGVHGTFTFLGTYTGQAYGDFLLGIPDSTAVIGANPPIYMTSTNYGLFFQDDYKVNPHLTLNLGLRWDYQGAIYNENNAFYNFDPATGGLIKAAANTPVNSTFRPKYPLVPIEEAAAVGLPERTLHFPDKNNFAPRIGFAWRPGRLANFVIRGGWAKFTDIIGQGVFQQFAGGGNGAFLTYASNSYPNGRPVNNIMPATAFRFPYPFPATFGVAASPSLAASGFNPHLANPYVQQWNLTLEQAVFGTALRVSYVGTKSTNLVYRRDINQRITAGNNASRPYTAFGFGSNIDYMDNGGSQMYHGLQLKAEKRLQKGLMFQGGYVWGNNISDVIDGSDTDYAGIATDARNRAIDRGRIGYSRQHNLTGTAIWELPFGRGHRLLRQAPGWLHQVVSGWQLYPQFFSASGQWFTARRQGVNPLTNLTDDTARADRVGSGNDGPKQAGTSVAKWINTAAFAQPAATALGNAGRNILEGPGFWSLHLGLTKKIRFREGKELWLSITSQNVLNHPNWATPSASGEVTVGQAAFGSTSTLLGQDRGAYATARWVLLRGRIVF